MQKPRPKEAPAPQRQRSARDNRGSHEGASAPLVVSGGEQTAETPSKPDSNGAFPKADAMTAQKPDTGPAVIVFGYNEHQVPHASWLPATDAALATRAALLLGLRVLKIETDAHRALAARIMQGPQDG